MFRCILPRLAIGSYSLFMIEQKNNPQLQGLKVTERSKLMAKLYKELTPTDVDALKKRAADTPSFGRQKKPHRSKSVESSNLPKQKREPSLYTKFVKENIHKFKSLERSERLKAVAKLWQQQKSQSTSSP